MYVYPMFQHVFAFQIKTCLQCSKTSKFTAQTRELQTKRVQSLKPGTCIYCHTHLQSPQLLTSNKMISDFAVG